MPAINHIHTYVKYKSREGFYRCEAPNCTHTIDKELLLGKLNLCCMCGSQMILTRDDLRRVRPRCLDCSETKRAKLHKKAQELTKNLGTSSFDPLNFKLKSTQPSLDFDISNLRAFDSEIVDSEIVDEPDEPEDFKEENLRDDKF